MSTVLTDRPPRPQDTTPDGPEHTELDRFLEAQRAGRMGPRLQAAAGGGPASCHVLDAKYEPGVRAILLYEHAGRLVRGDLMGDGAGAGDWSGDVVAPGVRLSWFPQDPELPTLPQVMDPVHLGPALAAALGPAPYPLVGAGAPCRLALLRYRPGKRATVLVRRPGQARRFVAKVYHDPAKAAAVVDEAPALAAACSVEGSRLRVAETVAHLPDLAVVVQLEVSGTPLDALLMAGAAAAREGVAAAGRALAELHVAEVATARERPVGKELRRFRLRAERIASVDARAGEVLGGLAERLQRLHDDLPAARTGPVHGDCKPSQFLCAGERVFLMDLDHVGISDQAVDVGTFLASLRQRGLRGSSARAAAGGADCAEALAAQFLDSYLAARGDDRDRVRIRWHEAAALQRKALRAFARAPRSPVALALAASAGRCLDKMVEAA